MKIERASKVDPIDLYELVNPITGKIINYIKKELIDIGQDHHADFHVGLLCVTEILHALAMKMISLDSKQPIEKILDHSLGCARILIESGAITPHWVTSKDH